MKQHDGDHRHCAQAVDIPSVNQCAHKSLSQSDHYYLRSRSVDAATTTNAAS
jgi:hypothetical protein